MYWTKAELETGLRSKMRDPSGTGQRWTDEEMADAVNFGVSSFHNRVGFYVTAPIATDEDGFYVPPAYMQDQVLLYVDGARVTANVKPGDPTIDGADMVAWVYNQRIPTGNFTLDAPLVSGDTVATVSSDGQYPPMLGHFTVGLETFRYNGMEVILSGSFELQNLERNMNGGGDLSHLTDAPMDPTIWGDDTRLWDVIQMKAAAYLHQLYITDGSPTEIQHHQWSMRWNTQQTDNFWRAYVPRKQYFVHAARKVY